MKKITTYIGKSPMGPRQLRILKNNPITKLLLSEFGAMILLTAPVQIIKGNIGFSLNERDGDFIRKASAIHAAILANVGGYYAPPFADLAALNTAIIAFRDAIADVEAGVYGAESSKMDAKRDVMRLLKKALNYVNDIAFDSQDVAGEVITGAKMLINLPKLVDKQVLKAVLGPGTGVIRLLAKALKFHGKYVKTIYYWQFSIDNGTTWEDIPESQKAKTQVPGMLVGIETSFRLRTFSEKTGLSDWCDAVSIYPL